jgi:CRISPR-associated protein (TIGR02710 family)
LLIGGLEPERVAIILTKKTREDKFVEQVAQKLGYAADIIDTWLIPDENYESASEVYRGLKYVLDTWHNDWHELDPKTIAADVTGGFATMSVGLAKAAHVLQLTTVYVASKYANIDGRYQPKPGTQRLDLPPDPYAVFGDLEANEAKRLYAKYNYERAQAIFEKLAGNADIPEPDKSNYIAYEQLTRSYAAWDVFDWQEAKKGLHALLQSPGQLPNGLDQERPRLKAQLAMINQLAKDNADFERKKTPLSVLQSLDSVLPLLGTLYANAQRRASQMRYDVAAMFLYRCLELMSQHRLALRGVTTERPSYDALQKQVSDLKDRYATIERRIFRNNKGLPKNAITLFNGYMILEAIQDSLVDGYAIEQIKERTEARNKSMLAHGFRLIAENEYREFQQVVEEVLERFFQVSNRDRADWVQECSFLSPFAA